MFFRLPALRLLETCFLLACHVLLRSLLTAAKLTKSSIGLRMDAGVLLNPLLPDKHKDDVLQNRAYLLLAEVHAIHAKQELSECNYEQFSFIR